MSRFNAARSAFCLSNPKTVVLISPAMKKKVNPSSEIAFSNVERAFLTAAHPFELDSLWSRRDFGRCVPSSTQMLPAVIVSVMAASVRRTWDRGGGMGQPNHRVAADGAIALRD